MATVYFVTERYLKDGNVPLTKNIDANNILFNVRSSADNWTRKIMGTYFYNDMLVKYNANNMSSDELNLLDYIQISIAWRSAAECALTLSYVTRNKGIQTQFSDFSNNAEYKEIMFIYDNYTRKAESYDNILAKYILDNKTLFSSFTSDLNDDSIIKDCNGGNIFQPSVFFV